MNKIGDELIRWYRENKRDLPWRRVHDPYEIWISEVVLQQTRVTQGITYYHNFLKKFPNIFTLAEAETEEVYKIWQGLGYYSRARNLHQAAKFIVEKYAGSFPDEYAKLLEIKGVGHYIAAAIASIAFAQPYPAIDGNAYRLFTRLFGIELKLGSSALKKEVLRIVSGIIPQKSPGDFNQAVMDFASIVCTPKSPDCINCPLSGYCFALSNNRQTDFPVKPLKRKPKDRFINYYLFSDGKKLLIRKRKSGDIWENLYDFPNTESSNAEQPRFYDLVSENHPCGYTVKFVSEIIRHQLTHQTLFVTFSEIGCNILPKIEDFHAESLKHLGNLPWPRLITRYLEKRDKEQSTANY
ncbi:MAG: A/G-specific adenine glycosylase [Bacteroidetes bacterium]|nr:A/G-specific adenine glycosylase [Bacteroidota bacterium]MBU1719298.1 A/G-specific adenine glycosylase [Bacteroidota bacterium]